MNESPTPLGPAPAESDLTLESLAQQQQSLRAAFHVTLVLLIILAGSLFVFFLREVSITRRQITDLTQMVAEYEKTAVPFMEDFRAKLQSFARTHPDFNPIYLRYFGTNVAPLGQAGSRPQPVPTNPNPNAPRLPTAR